MELTQDRVKWCVLIPEILFTWMKLK